MNEFTKTDLETVHEISAAIASLEDHHGWKHLVKAAEALKRSHTPHISNVRNQDHAFQLASQLAYVSGIQACLNIVKQQKEELKALEDLLSRE